MRELVSERERRDIERTVDRILRDTGHVEPPLSLPIVRDLLRLDLRFYQLDDPTFTQELAHRVRVAGRQVVERPGLLIEAVRKANLSALWLPDTKRILIDQSVPTPKHRWIEAHEVGHSVIPWHAGFMFGDNEQTLD